MATQEKTQEGGKPRKGKWLIWILGIAGVVILLLFFGIPLFLSSAAGKNLVVSQINQSMDGQVQMDDLSVGWFKGVRIENASFEDDKGNTSVQVKRVATQPQYGALLGGKVKLGKTVIESPRVHLKVAPVEEKEPREKERRPKDEEGLPEMPIDQIDLEVVDGQAIIEMLGPQPQRISFTNIASTVTVSEAAKASTMALSMQVQDGQTPGQISAQGQVNAEKNWTIKDGDFQVKISKLQLASLKPLFALAGQDMDMAGELNADASVKLADNQVANLTANAVVTDFAQGTGQQRTVFTQPLRLTAQAAQQGDTIRIDKVNLQSGFFTVDSSGTLDNLKYSINADLAETQKFAGQFTDLGGLAMQGKLAVNGTVGMTDEAVTITSQGTAQQLVLSKEGVRTPATNAELAFEGSLQRKPEVLRVVSANVRSAPATVQVSNLSYPLAEKEGQPISLDAKTQADLAQVWPFIQVFAKTPEGMTVAGKMNAGLKVSTTGSELRVQTEDAAITGLSIDTPDSEPFVQERVSLKADVLMDTEDKTIDIKTLNLQGSQGQQLIEVTKGTVDRSVSQNTTTLKGNFETTYDLKALTSFAAAFVPEGLTMEGQRKAFFNFESQYPTDKPDLMMANLNGKGSAGFSAANYMGLKFGSTDFNVNIQKGVLQFELPDATVNEGTLRLAATMDLGSEQRMLKLTRPMKVLENIHLDDELTKKLLVNLNPMFANQANVTGFASLECSRLQIPLASPIDKKAILLNATVAMNDVNLKTTGLVGQILSRTEQRGEWKAELKPTQLLMEKGILQYKDMEFVMDRYPVGFSGRIDITQEPEPTADLSAALPYNLRLESVHVGEDMTQRVVVPLKGAISKLQIDFGALLQQNLQRGIEQEIKKQIPGLENIPFDIFR